MNEKLSSPAPDFYRLINERFNSLTKSEKRIARFLLRNQDEAAFMAVSDLADRLGLSEATVVRFAQALDFSGFPDMRSSLQDSFRGRVTHSVRLRGQLENLRQADDIFEQLILSEIDHLTQALQTVDRNAIQQAVELLRSRKHIYVFGLGPSISLVDLLTIRLTRVGHPVIPLTSSGREVAEPLLLMDKDDVLFAIGFFDVNPTLRMVLEHARDVGTPTILLTDTLEALVGDMATVVLAARRGPVATFHSLTVPMTIVNTLLLALAQVDQSLAMENLDKLDQLREQLNRSSSSLT
jgi:DNA-binding MurR/RpiR family transcriptional regulator